VLIGENLPHLWFNDDSYFKTRSRKKAEALVIHFNKNFAGEGFLSIPEMKMINDFIHSARRGIRFNKSTAKYIYKRMVEMLRMDDFNRLLELIRLLKYLSSQKDIRYLSSIGYLQSIQTFKKKKLDEVYEYIMKNFQKNISLDEIAGIANMNKSAFCRYFKMVNGKTFSDYMNEIRVGYACKLLLEQKYTIVEISDNSGYNNLSNFNRQFKKITGYSPSEYLNNYTK
jgi:AraC-like DNA-binding protein